MQKPNIPSGTRDFLPYQVAQRNTILSTIKKVLELYGFEQIETPAMELLSVLTGKYGDEGDQLLFKILNSGDFLKDIKKEEIDELTQNPKKFALEICEKALRYDLTVPMARFVVMNQNELIFPFKRYQCQPVWRGDRPAKGRYREFVQFDADIVGSDSLIYESELIAIYDQVFANLGFQNYTIFINNRKLLNGLVEIVNQTENFSNFCVIIDKLDKIGFEKVEEELKNIGFIDENCKIISDIFNFKGSIFEKLDFLKTMFVSSETGLKGIQEVEEVMNIYKNDPILENVVLDLSLARGLTYYTGLILEVKIEGSGVGSVGEGGRYAELTQMFGKENLSGVGISFGIDRIYDSMLNLNLLNNNYTSPTQVFIAHFDSKTRFHALKVAKMLRELNVAVEVYPEIAKIKKQMEFANKKKYPFVIVIGENELKSEKYQLKNMATSEQSEMFLYEIIKVINSELLHS